MNAVLFLMHVMLIMDNVNVSQTIKAEDVTSVMMVFMDFLIVEVCDS